MLMMPKGYEKAQPGTMPDANAVAAMMKYNEALQKAGVLLALDGLHPPAARKTLAAARNLRDGGSLTVIATATRPFGGETTVIALDGGLTESGLPILDLAASGTLKPELLVGEDGAKAIAKARVSSGNISLAVR